MARAHYTNVAWTHSGEDVQIVPNAEITLFEDGTSTPLAATIYAADTGGTTLANPFFADDDGNFEFYLAEGQRFKVQIHGTLTGTITLDHLDAHNPPNTYLPGATGADVLFAVEPYGGLQVHDDGRISMLGAVNDPSLAITADFLALASYRSDDDNGIVWGFEHYTSNPGSAPTIDPGTIRVLMHAEAGFGSGQIRALEVQTVRDAGTTSGVTKIIEAGLHVDTTLPGNGNDVTYIGAHIFTGAWGAITSWAYGNTGVYISGGFDRALGFYAGASDVKAFGGASIPAGTRMVHLGQNVGVMGRFVAGLTTLGEASANNANGAVARFEAWQSGATAADGFRTYKSGSDFSDSQTHYNAWYTGGDNRGYLQNAGGSYLGLAFASNEVQAIIAGISGGAGNVLEVWTGSTVLSHMTSAGRLATLLGHTIGTLTDVTNAKLGIKQSANTASDGIRTFMFDAGTPTSILNNLAVYMGGDANAYFQTFKDIASASVAGSYLVLGGGVADAAALVNGKASLSGNILTLQVASSTKAAVLADGQGDFHTGGVRLFTKAGTISDSDFANPADGLTGIDTTNHRLYYREGGAWHYMVRDA